MNCIDLIMFQPKGCTTACFCCMKPHNAAVIYRLYDQQLNIVFIIPQVMETKNMLYLVSEYAPNGEIFGKSLPCLC